MRLLTSISIILLRFSRSKFALGDENLIGGHEFEDGHPLVARQN